MQLSNYQTRLAGTRLIEPRAFGDERGFFLETWRELDYRQLGIDTAFVQDNAAFSRRGVLRGMHYQLPRPQGKLVSVLYGEVFDVVVDLRAGSPTFGQWEGHILSASNHRQLWIPAGFAHGYQVVSENALFAYKCTEYYDSECEALLSWCDPAIAIQWPIAEAIVSAKDQAAPSLADIPTNKLFGSTRA